MSDFERARRPEQKLIRRKAIVDAAVALFDAGGLDGTSLSAVARAAGLSKANLYRYFDSREAILLQVLSDEQAAWLDRITTDLAGLAGKDDIDAVANVLADSLADRPRLLALMAAFAGKFHAKAPSVALAPRSIVSNLRRIGKAFRLGRQEDAHEFLLTIDTTRNKPEIHESGVIDWDKDHGTRAEIEMEAP